MQPSQPASAHGAPLCQVAGCFEAASVYVVIRETDIPITARGYAALNVSEDHDFNSFKLILYLCERHDYDLDYLISDNELEIANRRYLALRNSSDSTAA